MTRGRQYLVTTPAESQADVLHFFNQFAAFNTEQHGTADRLLDYRMKILKQFASFNPEDIVLDIGCGDGKHLFELDKKIGKGIGIDFSDKMIAVANKKARTNCTSSFCFRTDDAQHLNSIQDESVDVVICTGALEHMFDKKAVMHSIYRTLRPGGRFVCLTLNDQFLWYSKWAPALKVPTYHLATDKRINSYEARALLEHARFSDFGVDYWTFIPRGDMPSYAAKISTCIDFVGHLGASKWLRSGLILHGTK